MHMVDEKQFLPGLHPLQGDPARIGIRGVRHHPPRTGGEKSGIVEGKERLEGSGVEPANLEGHGDLHD